MTTLRKCFLCFIHLSITVSADALYPLLSILGLQLSMFAFILVLTMTTSWAGIVIADLDEASVDASSRRLKRPSKEPTIGPAQSLMDPNDGTSSVTSLKPSDGSTGQLTDEVSDKPSDGESDKPSDGVSDEPSGGVSNSPGDVVASDQPADGTSDQPSFQPSKHRRRLKRPTQDPNSGPTRRPRRTRKPSLSPSV